MGVRLTFEPLKKPKRIVKRVKRGGGLEPSVKLGSGMRMSGSQRHVMESVQRSSEMIIVL
jgi:hypothetical protein